MKQHTCDATCRCPLCDETCAAIMTMAQTDLESYARFNQEMTARMLSTAPDGGRQAVARHMGDYTSTGEQSTAYRTVVQAPAPEGPAPARTATPPEVVRAMVAAKRREMAAEREAAATRRRVANEIAAAYRAVSSRPVPEPYTEALKGRMPEVWQSDGITPPLPYDLAMAERGTMPEIWRSTGDDPPEPYTEALRRRERS